MPKLSAVIWALGCRSGRPKGNGDRRVGWRVVQLKSGWSKLKETVSCMQQESNPAEALHDYPVDRHVRVRSW